MLCAIAYEPKKGGISIEYNFLKKKVFLKTDQMWKSKFAISESLKKTSVIIPQSKTCLMYYVCVVRLCNL